MGQPAHKATFTAEDDLAIAQRQHLTSSPCTC